MFTGIVEEVGQIEAMSNYGQNILIAIKAKRVLEHLQIGDSIAVNGICLTVIKITDSSFQADVMPETLRRSSLAHARVRSYVNLERALKIGDRLGGHLVSGHIDGIGTIHSIMRERNAVILRIRAAESLLRYMVQKGSVALDGVSLTLLEVGRDMFSVSIIPHSAERTIIGFSKPGDHINIECDVIGKYVERLLRFDQQTITERGKTGVEGKAAGLSLNDLKDNGF